MSPRLHVIAHTRVTTGVLIHTILIFYMKIKTFAGSMWKVQHGQYNKNPTTGKTKEQMLKIF